MTVRIQIPLDPEEAETYRRLAEARGQSLSAWLRDAAQERAAREGVPRFDSPRDLRQFFARWDALSEEIDGPVREPDWHEHLAVLERSKRGTLTITDP